MNERTARFSLPFILPGQAQKELFHNEALVLIDGAMHACAESECAIPPADLAAGMGFLVSANPSGVFAGHANELAIYTEGGWRFVEPREGFAVWVRDQGTAMRWRDGAWSAAQTCSELRVNGQQVVGARAPAVASPSGGTVIDVQARAAITSLIATFKSHGLTN